MGTESGDCCEPGQRKFDYLLWFGLSFVAIAYIVQFVLQPSWPVLGTICAAVYELFNTMFWGLLVGLFMVAALAKVPRELVLAVLGRHAGLGGLLRATAAGVLLDLCSHGILMIGAKLYERGASLGQVMAFLIASPWNSLSLTVILVALIGLKWTLVFIAGSVVIAVITGALFDRAVAHNILPRNPNREALPEVLDYKKAWKELRGSIGFSWGGALDFFALGLREGRIVIRWLFFGIFLAATIRGLMHEEMFSTYFGPSVLGLTLTMLAATIIEVCSEGSTPIASDIFNRAAAPGNAFAFLMAGVSTDYTEIMVIKDATRSWKIALFLPLFSLPQILLIAFLLNQF